MTFPPHNIFLSLSVSLSLTHTHAHRLQLLPIMTILFFRGNLWSLFWTATATTTTTSSSSLLSPTSLLEKKSGDSVNLVRLFKEEKNCHSLKRGRLFIVWAESQRVAHCWLISGHSVSSVSLTRGDENELKKRLHREWEWSQTHTLSLSHTHTHIHSLLLSHTHILSHTHTYTLSPSLSHTYTLAHTHSVSI